MRNIFAELVMGTGLALVVSGLWGLSPALGKIAIGAVLLFYGAHLVQPAPPSPTTGG